MELSPDKLFRLYLMTALKVNRVSFFTDFKVKKNLFRLAYQLIENDRPFFEVSAGTIKDR